MRRRVDDAGMDPAMSEVPAPAPDQAPGLWVRLGWFGLLWLAGVASIAFVAGLLRLVAA